MFLLQWELAECTGMRLLSRDFTSQCAIQYDQRAIHNIVMIYFQDQHWQYQYLLETHLIYRLHQWVKVFVIKQIKVIDSRWKASIWPQCPPPPPLPPKNLSKLKNSKEQHDQIIRKNTTVLLSVKNCINILHGYIILKQWNENGHIAIETITDQISSHLLLSIAQNLLSSPAVCIDV